MSDRSNQNEPWCPCHAVQQNLSISHGRWNPILITKTKQRLQSDKRYCSSCIQVALQDFFHQHEMVRKEHDQRRLWCMDQVHQMRTSRAVLYRPCHESSTRVESDRQIDVTASPLQQLSEDQAILIQLRSHLSKLQLKCNTAAMELARLSCQNEERAHKLNQDRKNVQAAQQGIQVLFHSVIANNVDDIFSNRGSETPVEEASGLNHVIQISIQNARKIRFKLALQAFEIFKIDVGQEYAHLTSLTALTQTGTKAYADTESQDSNRRDRLLLKKIPTGIGKISGLPLPHAGSALYGIMPSSVLTSSLRLIASLTTLLSKCLAISLPHPILLHPLLDPSYKMKEDGDIVHDKLDHSITTVVQQEEDLVTLQDIHRLGHENHYQIEPNQYQHSDTTDRSMASPERTTPSSTTDSFSSTASSTFHTISSSSSSLISMMKSSSNKITRSAHKVLDKMTGHVDKSFLYEPIQNQNHEIVPAMDNESVKLRLSYAVSAKICENIDSKKDQLKKTTPSKNCMTVYDLKLPPSSSDNRDDRLKLQENFTIGLELLQNNIVGLCVHSGVPISTLWPAEALLLNLYSLMLHCREEVGCSFSC